MVSYLIVGPSLIGGALFLAAIVALILCCIRLIKRKRNPPKRKSTEGKKNSLELVKRKFESVVEDTEEYADIPDIEPADGLPSYATSQAVSNEAYDSVDCERLSATYEELPEEHEAEMYRTSHRKISPVHLDTIVIWKEQPYQHLFRESKVLNFRTWLQSRDIAVSTVQALEKEGVSKVSDLHLMTEDNIKRLRLTMGECNRLRAVLTYVKSIDTAMEWT